MPQMAPISWLSLFIVFSITLVIFNTMNYFIYTPQSQKKNSKMMSSTSPMNWKW